MQQNPSRNMNLTISPPSKGAGLKLKLMFAVLKLMTIFVSCMKAMKLSRVNPKLVRALPLAVVSAVRLLVNW